MNSVMWFVVLGLSCLSMVFLAGGSPLPSPSDQETSDTSPDLSSMLNILGGNINVHSLLGFLKEFKLAGNVWVTLMKESPPLRQVFQAASKKNAKVRVLIKAAEGKFPDLKDLYDLATDNKKSLFSTVNAETHNITDWKKLSYLLAHKDFLTSYDSLSTFMSLFTGGQVAIPPSVLKAMVSSGDAALPDVGPYEEFVKLLLFINTNLGKMQEAVQLIMDNPINYTQVAHDIVSLNMDHFPGITRSQKNINGKYTVTGGIKADPDAAKVLDEIQHLRELVSNHASLSEMEGDIVALSEEFLTMLSNAIAKAETAGKSSKTSRPTGVVG